MLDFLSFSSLFVLFQNKWRWYPDFIQRTSTSLENTKRRLGLLLVLLFSLYCLAPTHGSAQYVEGDNSMVKLTEADYVTEDKPKWLGPYNWFWLPYAGYKIKVFDRSNLSVSEMNSKFETMDTYSCIVLDKDVRDPKSAPDLSVRCKPPVFEKRGGLGPYGMKRLEDGVLPPVSDTSSTAYASYVDKKTEGDGFGQVVFTWNWTRYKVHEKLCDSLKVSDMTRDELVNGQGLTDLSRQERLDGAPMDPEDINVEPVKYCEDDPAYEGDVPNPPYDYFEEMKLAEKKAILQLIEEYDNGHTIGWPYSQTWREQVPDGWFMGENANFNKNDFMEWCLEGGKNPFSPKPFPGLKEGEYDQSEGSSGSVSVGGEGSPPETKNPWEKTSNLADEGGAYSAIDGYARRAERRCQRMYNDILNRRRRAFLDLCEQEPYGHFKGCKAEINRIKGRKVKKNGQTIHQGVSQCCTDTQTEFHYKDVKTFEVPCKPFAAMRWTNGGTLLGMEGRDQWDVVQGDQKIAYLGGDGFVGSQGIITRTLLGGMEPIKVAAKPKPSGMPRKIGSMFYFDLKSGTISFRSFDSLKVKQKVVLPPEAKEAEESDFWAHGHGVKGTKKGRGPFGLPPTRRDYISDQRGPGAQDGLEGWVYNLYFCEKKFTQEEVGLIQDKWDSVDSKLEKQADEICAEGEVYDWSSEDSKYKCMSKEEAPSEYTEGDPPDTPLYCAGCGKRFRVPYSLKDQFIDPKGEKGIASNDNPLPAWLFNLGGDFRDKPFCPETVDSETLENTSLSDLHYGWLPDEGENYSGWISTEEKGKAKLKQDYARVKCQPPSSVDCWPSYMWVSADGDCPSGWEFVRTRKVDDSNVNPPECPPQASDCRDDGIPDKVKVCRSKDNPNCSTDAPRTRAWPKPEEVRRYCATCDVDPDAAGPPEAPTHCPKEDYTDWFYADRASEKLGPDSWASSYSPNQTKCRYTTTPKERVVAVSDSNRYWDRAWPRKLTEKCRGELLKPYDPDGSDAIDVPGDYQCSYNHEYTNYGGKGWYCLPDCKAQYVSGCTVNRLPFYPDESTEGYPPGDTCPKNMSLNSDGACVADCPDWDREYCNKFADAGAEIPERCYQNLCSTTSNNRPSWCPDRGSYQWCERRYNETGNVPSDCQTHCSDKPTAPDPEFCKYPGSLPWCLQHYKETNSVPAECINNHCGIDSDLIFCPGSPACENPPCDVGPESRRQIRRLRKMRDAYYGQSDSTKTDTTAAGGPSRSEEQK